MAGLKAGAELRQNALQPPTCGFVVRGREIMTSDEHCTEVKGHGIKATLSILDVASLVWLLVYQAV